MRMKSAANATTGVRTPPTAMAVTTAKATIKRTPTPMATRVNVMRPVPSSTQSHGLTAPKRRTRRWYSITAS